MKAIKKKIEPPRVYVFDSDKFAKIVAATDLAAWKVGFNPDKPEEFQNEIADAIHYAMTMDKPWRSLDGQGAADEEADWIESLPKLAKTIQKGLAACPSDLARSLVDAQFDRPYPDRPPALSINRLKEIAAELSLAARAAKSIRKSQSRWRTPPFKKGGFTRSEQLVRRLRCIYQRYTGKSGRPTWIDSDKTILGGPFVDFVNVVLAAYGHKKLDAGTMKKALRHSA